MTRHNQKRLMVDVAVAMLSLLSRGRHEFGLDVVRNHILGSNRLHAVLRLQLFTVSPYIIVHDLLANVRGKDSAVRAARNYPLPLVSNVLKTVANFAEDPARLLAYVGDIACFQYGFDVTLESLHWTEVKARDFIREICEGLSMPIPEEAKPLFVRVELEKHVSSYLRGETEVDDLFNVCIALTDGAPSLLSHCHRKLSAAASVPAEFLAQRANCPFTPVEGASDFEPFCNDNLPYHALATGRIRVLDENETVKELEEVMSDARHFSMFFKTTLTTNHKQSEFVVFRFRGRAYLFSRRHCGSFRGRLASALSAHTEGKIIFVFDKDLAAKSLESEFGFVSRELVDVRELAKEKNVGTTLSAMVEATVGGEICRRAKNFPGTALPSVAAMQHLDLIASVIYTFGVQFRGLMAAEMDDMRDDLARRERRGEREAEKKDGSSRSRSRIR